MVFLLLTGPNIAVAQETPVDSTLFFQQVQDLIDQHQYASANFLLEDRIQREGMKPVYICWMVKNGLQHYYRHKNYNIFYLKDENSYWKQEFQDTLKNVRIARLRYPQRLLQRLINQNPENPWAYKLLGDYYDVQFQDYSDFELVREDVLKSLEEKIFSNYSRADKMGYPNVYMHRWLGDYYLNANQIDQAEKYYLKNVQEAPKDAISLYRLADISYRRKRYTQTYNYTTEALQNLAPEDIYLKYDAIRLSANALKALGEMNKFVIYVKEAIQLMPDLQDAYIDLFTFYRERENTEEAGKVLETMLLNNPYDLKGYRVLENYVVEVGSYFFADTLYEEMLVRYENWDEVLANIYWSKGNLAYHQGLNSEAKKFWEISRNYMRHYLPEESPLLQQVGEIQNKKVGK